MWVWLQGGSEQGLNETYDDEEEEEEEEEERGGADEEEDDEGLEEEEEEEEEQVRGDIKDGTGNSRRRS